MNPDERMVWIVPFSPVYHATRDCGAVKKTGGWGVRQMSYADSQRGMKRRPCQRCAIGDVA